MSRVDFFEIPDRNPGKPSVEGKKTAFNMNIVIDHGRSREPSARMTKFGNLPFVSRLGICI